MERVRVCPQDSPTIRPVRGIRLLQFQRDRRLYLAAEHGTLTPHTDQATTSHCLAHRRTRLQQGTARVGVGAKVAHRGQHEQGCDEEHPDDGERADDVGEFAQMDWTCAHVCSAPESRSRLCTQSWQMARASRRAHVVPCCCAMPCCLAPQMALCLAFPAAPPHALQRSKGTEGFQVRASELAHQGRTRSSRSSAAA